MTPSLNLKVTDIAAMIVRKQIYLGMTKADLRALLGPPHDWNVPTRKYNEPYIWKYADVEFWWHTQPRQRTPYPGPDLIGVYYECPRDGVMLLK